MGAVLRLGKLHCAKQLYRKAILTKKRWRAHLPATRAGQLPLSLTGRSARLSPWALDAMRNLSRLTVIEANLMGKQSGDAEQ